MKAFCDVTFLFIVYYRTSTCTEKDNKIEIFYLIAIDPKSIH